MRTLGDLSSGSVDYVPKDPSEQPFARVDTSQEQQTRLQWRFSSVKREVTPRACTFLSIKSEVTPRACTFLSIKTNRGLAFNFSSHRNHSQRSPPNSCHLFANRSSSKVFSICATINISFRGNKWPSKYWERVFTLPYNAPNSSKDILALSSP